MEERESMYRIIDGKKFSQEIKDELKNKMTEMNACGQTRCLAVIRVGDDAASAVYVRNKERACQYIGIQSLSYELPRETTEAELLDLIGQLNRRGDVSGILVQLPLPAHIREDKVQLAIAPEKDVDGFHPLNVGNVNIGRPGYMPCTPAGVIEMLKRSEIEIEGKECVVLGRSNIVGKPMGVLLLRENATVTICHSRTRNLKEITRRADILVAAVGRPGFVDESYVKEGAVVIDVGIHRDENGRICGDVDFDSVAPKAYAITPVPGGVGPMTIAMLMKNCVCGMA